MRENRKAWMRAILYIGIGVVVTLGIDPLLHPRPGPIVPLHVLQGVRADYTMKGHTPLPGSAQPESSLTAQVFVLHHPFEDVLRETDADPKCSTAVHEDLGVGRLLERTYRAIRTPGGSGYVVTVSRGRAPDRNSLVDPDEDGWTTVAMDVFTPISLDTGGS